MASLSYRIFGVGGAGGKIANAVAQRTGSRLSAVAIDTDFSAVSALGACQQIRIGEDRFHGNGSGGDVSGAHMEAKNKAGDIARLFDDVSVAAIVTGLGGGTGPGAVSVLLSAAEERNVPVVLFLILPFTVEGSDRARAAASAMRSLAKEPVLRVAVSNDDLVASDPNASLSDAFAAATNTLADALSLIWECSALPGYITLSAGDWTQIVRNARGDASFGTGSGEGEARLSTALDALWRTPGTGLSAKASSSKAALVAIAGGRDMRLSEIGETMRSVAGALPMDAKTRLATVVDPALEGRIRVSAFLFRSWEDGEADASAQSGSAVPTAGDLSATAPVTQASSHSNSLPGRFFENIAGTFVNGQNLDQPTYLRKHIHVDLS